MSKHEKYSGSTIELTSLCPGSAKARSGLGEIPGSAAAERGTRIHERIEALFKTAKDTNYLQDTEELIAQGVLTTLLEVAAEHGFTKDEIEVEKKVMFGPNAGGKLDYGAFKVFGDLFIADTKTGFNQIMAEKNIQMLFYACSYLNGLDPFIAATLNNVHLIILQSDTEAPYEVHVRRWTLSLSELAQYAIMFKDAIGCAEASPDLRIPGEHCMDKYCPVRSTCPERIRWLSDASNGDFERLLNKEKVGPGRGQRLSDNLAVISAIEDWCKANKEDAKNLLMQDITAVPGWTLQDGQGNRAWIDDKEVMAEAKKVGLKQDEFAPRSLIEPAPFERLLKAKKLALDLTPLVQRPNIGAKLVQAKNGTKTLEEVFS